MCVASMCLGYGFSFPLKELSEETCCEAFLRLELGVEWALLLVLVVVVVVVRGGRHQKLVFPSQENNSAHSFFPSSLLFLFPSCSSPRTQLARSHPLKLAPARPANSARVVLARGRLRNHYFCKPFHTPLPSTPRSGRRHSSGIYISLQSAQALAQTLDSARQTWAVLPLLLLPLVPLLGHVTPLWMCRLPLPLPPSSSSHSALHRPSRLT